jgi:uncharacterized coiled-coil protein SlyX
MSVQATPGDASPDGHFEKRVELVEKDDAEQIARGAVLVPAELDHQGDYIREDTIRDAAAAFETRFEDGDALPGVMHVIFPDDEIELVESRVLDDPETIGTKTFPTGTWIQAYRYTGAELWQLVRDGILGGNSIGGTAKGAIHEPGTLPDDVTIPDAVQAELDEADLTRDDIAVREITEARILEVSAVDKPAVPRAVHAETKALAKAAPALTENVIAARLYLEARGHDPEDARRLAEYLNERKAASGGLIERAKSWFSGGDGSGIGGDGADDSTDQSTTGAESPVDAVAETDMSEDELTNRLEAVTDRLDDIESKLSESEADAEADDGEETNKDDGNEPTTEEKVDQLADAVSQMADSQATQAELLERMADAQGVSQQADPGAAADGGEEKVWSENSPFAPPGGDA